MLPQGRIAMLFTDIEGSTRMVHDLGPVYADVLRDQRRLIRSAIAQFHGHEMGTEGDSFFVVFSTVEEALRAAVTSQRALAAHRWPGGGRVRVRMGLHAGEPERHEEGYVGVDLNRAARVASTAHGGQIVMSGEFHHEAVSVAIRGLSFRDLGLHRLKDLPAPEHLYQVLAPDLPDITTAVKSLGAPSNLPGERNPLIGRDELVANLVDLLHEGERLITLIGPGGVGKTSAALRIAREASSEFIEGVYFVALEHATTEDEAWGAIVSAIDSSSSEESPETSAVRILGDRRVLLVLDNLEQLRAAAAVAVMLLERTSAVLLATSRGALEVRGELPVVVPPLPLPEPSLVGAAPVETVLEGPAVALFAREAQRARPSFALSADNVADVAEVCKRLDGLPLAIELAAARIRLLSPQRLLESLSAQLWLQSSEGDRPDRQRTLRGAIEWSFELLAEPEQQWFVALAVFEGGADLTAVEAIGPAVVGVPDTFTVVSELARVGLVTLADAPDGGVRITMLTAVRELAGALLQQGPDTDAIARLHAQHYTELAEDAEVNLRGPHQLVWADRITLEQANLAVAFAWANRGSVDDRGLALRMASALGWFWYTHGRAAEGRTWLERALAGTNEGAAQDVAVPIARAAHALGVLQQQQGENEAATRSFERALELWRADGQEAKIAQELNSLGVTKWASSEPVAARAHFEESILLARRCGDEARVASALSNLGLLTLGVGSPEEAVGYFEQALRIDQLLQNPWGEAVDRINIGAALARTDVARAHTVLVDVLQTSFELDDPDLVANTIESLALAAGTAGKFRHAVVLVAAADALRTSAAIPRAPVDDAYLERGLGPARAALSPDEQASAQAEGIQLRGADLIRVASTPLA